MKFIQQAYKGENSWWAYVITFALLFLGWQLIGVLPLVIVAFMKAGDIVTFTEAAQNNFTSLNIDANLYLFLVIFTFIGGLAFLLLGVKAIHKRGIETVFTSRKKIDWSRFFYAFFVWGIIGVGMIVIGYFTEPENFVWNFKPIKFTILVLVSVLFMPFQTTMEEVLMRGYLMQGFGTWFKNSFVALVLTSTIFGLLHFANPEVQKLGMILMVYYIGTGFLLGILTLMDEGIELSMGFHAANNIVAAIFVTTNWTVFQTDALLVDISEPEVGWEIFAPVFILYPLVLFIFSKKYNWTDWKGKLTGRVFKPIEFDEDKFIA